MKQPYKYIRQICQVLFLATCLLIGYEFYLFATPLEQGAIPVVSRPPGVEAFLPISALVSLKYFVFTGVINEIHPSALVIFCFAMITALIIKKSFCSWVCPVGLISEGLHDLRTQLFKRLSIRHFAMPRLLDTIFRAVKYLLLLFFLYTILYSMHPEALKQFIYSAYHVVADLKMLYFFTKISTLALGVLLALTGLSLVFPYFWCRYLCPYGALVGLISFLSPIKVRRNLSTCTSCRQCDRVCPSSIRVSQCKTVQSDECFACGKCVDVCPEDDTLGLGLPGQKAVVSPWVVGGFIVLVFLGGSLLARGTGHWQNQVSHQTYLGAMMETDLLDLEKVKDFDALVQTLDRRGKRVLMMKMMPNKE